MLFFNDVNDMNRSFPPVRMTTKRNAVILTEGKDLYEMFTNSIPNPSSYPEIMAMKSQQLTLVSYLICSTAALSTGKASLNRQMQALKLSTSLAFGETLSPSFPAKTLSIR